MLGEIRSKNKSKVEIGNSIEGAKVNMKELSIKKHYTIARISFQIIILVAILLTGFIYAYAEEQHDTQIAIFPFHGEIRISQGYGPVYGSYSHNQTTTRRAVDFAGYLDVYAPFDLKIVHLKPEDNSIVAQSLEEVYLANGTKSIVSIHLAHCNDLSPFGIYIGKTFRQGELFYRGGTKTDMGNLDGAHVHMECSNAALRWDGYYISNAIAPDEVFYVDQSVTPQIDDSRARQFTWNYLDRNLSVGQTGFGIVSGTPAGRYRTGEQIVLTATPNDKSSFVNWTITGVSGIDISQPTIRFTMPKNDVEITANFKTNMLLYNCGWKDSSSLPQFENAQLSTTFMIESGKMGIMPSLNKVSLRVSTNVNALTGTSGNTWGMAYHQKVLNLPEPSDLDTGEVRRRSYAFSTDLSDLMLLGFIPLSISNNTTYYYVWVAYVGDDIVISSVDSITPYNPLVTWSNLNTDSTSPGLFNGQVNWDTSLEMLEVGCLVSDDEVAVRGATRDNTNGCAVRRDFGNDIHKDSSKATSTTYGTIIFYKGPSFDTIASFDNGRGYYYKFYAYSNDGKVTYSRVSIYIPGGVATLTDVPYARMMPSEDQTITVGDSITLEFESNHAVGWRRHILNLNSNYDLCDNIMSSCAAGTSTYIFNAPGEYLVYMEATHQFGMTTTNAIYITVLPVDSASPQIVSASVGNVTNISYEVYVTASDDVELTTLQICTWHDDMSMDEAVWQSMTPNADGSATFQVRYQDFGFAQDVIYHTNVYAYDKAGNVSEPVRAGDPVLNKEITFQISILYEGDFSRTMPGIFTQMPAGQRVDLSVFPVVLSDQEREEFVFNRWEVSSGVVLENAQDENTSFIMPETSVTLTRIYVHRNPVRNSATFVASTGGDMYVLDPETNICHKVTQDSPLTLNLPEGLSVAIYAEPWDFYDFNGWVTDDFRMQSVSNSAVQWISMPAHTAEVCAVFSPAYYAINDSMTLHLPDGLQMIEEDAFLNVAARYFVVPESVTSIGSHAFPRDAVVYLPISKIDRLPLNAIAGRGTYVDYEEEGDVGFAKAAAGTPYVVLNAHGKPFEEIWSEWSDWSEIPVYADGRTQVETITQYSYRDTTYDTRYTEWSDWSNWSTTRQTTSDLRREESTPLYIWYWYECPSCGHNDPTYGSCSQCGAKTTYSDYEIELLPVTQYGDGTYASGSRRAYDLPNYGTTWYNVSDNANYSYTGYRYSTRSTYVVPIVGNWSEYSEIRPEEQANREIQARTLYCYRTVME